ncbi:MAG: hypothetical protein KKB25_03530 [Nanoarchaeota archaeon]|nr:hypothetical protein [Nanoarchaeota archaeon]
MKKIKRGFGNIEIFRRKRKGQMFLITGIFVLLILVLLRTETAQPGKGAFYAGLDWKDSFDNLENEYRKTADISLAQENSEQNLESNLNNFSNFSQDSFGQRGYILQMFYSLAFLNSTNITVAVGNFQGVAVSNISVNTSGGWSAFFPSLADRTSNTTVFPIAGSFNATVSYYLNNTAKSLAYSADSNITAALYFTLRLQQADSFADDILVFNKTLG